MTPQELRNSILQLAIQGKLVEQRPEEGTAAELLRCIEENRAKQIKLKRAKAHKNIRPITKDAIYANSRR